MPAIELGLRVFPAFELETLALHNDLLNGIYTISSPGFQLTNKSLCKSWGLSASRIPWVCVSHSVMSNSSDSLDCSPPGSSVHGILQARILEWIAISFSRGIFLTQKLKPGFLHCRQILYRLSYKGSPMMWDNSLILSLSPSPYSSWIYR